MNCCEAGDLRTEAIFTYSFAINDTTMILHVMLRHERTSNPLSSSPVIATITTPGYSHKFLAALNPQNAIWKLTFFNAYFVRVRVINDDDWWVMCTDRLISTRSPVTCLDSNLTCCQGCDGRCVEVRKGPKRRHWLKPEDTEGALQGDDMRRQHRQNSNKQRETPGLYTQWGNQGIGDRRETQLGEIRANETREAKPDTVT